MPPFPFVAGWGSLVTRNLTKGVRHRPRALGEAHILLIDQAGSLLPCIKITELLMDVDEWTRFTRHFVHLKSSAQAQDKTLSGAEPERPRGFHAQLAGWDGPDSTSGPQGGQNLWLCRRQVWECSQRCLQ